MRFIIKVSMVWLGWLLKKVYRININGLHHLDEAGGRVLIIANHTSFLDAVLLTLFLPEKISFAIHSEYAKAWWMRPFKYVIQLFAIDHGDPMAMRGLIAQVKAGNRVVIFPEGRITVTGALMKIFAGPGMVADKADATILPIRIDGAQYTPFSRVKGRIRLRWFPKISLTVLKPRRLELPEGLSARQRRQQAGHTLADIMTEMVYATTACQRRLWDALRDAAHVHGRHHLVLEDTARQPLSYQQLFTRALILGEQLKPYCQGDAPVGVFLPNASSTVITFFALHSQAAVPAMLNYTMGEAALRSALHSAKITTILTSRRFIKLAELGDLIEALSKTAKVVYLEDLAQGIGMAQKLKGAWQSLTLQKTLAQRLCGVSHDDAAAVLFTSGSEGRPKGVVLSHRNLLSNIAQITSRMEFNANDVCLNALPLFHSFGLTAATLLPLLSGIRTFLYPSPLHYKVIPAVAYDINATLLFGTNVFLAGYAKHAHPYDFYSLRYVIAGAEKLQESTRQVWQEKFGLRILEGYGATETSPVLSINTPMYCRKGSVGRLLPGITARLEAVPGIKSGGRLWVRGANVMVGYYLHDKPGLLQPPEDGWYDTGDIVTLDDEGFVWIQGRAKRFAKVAGEMVSLTSVEALLKQCWPDDVHVALSVSDASKGEQIIALSNADPADRKTLLAFAKSQGVNELQVPRQIKYVPEIPLLGSGKIDYVAAQALL